MERPQTPISSSRRRKTLRYVSMALMTLFIAACQPSCNDYARGPVPASTLPFAEPVQYASLPSNSASGHVGAVPEQHGLLASYFASTAFNRLDHQQIDPQVDFIWDVNNPPVPGSFDTDDGMGMHAPWGIWSVVWEGYLQVPVEGDYLLGTSSDDGSWIQIKDSSGQLVTVVDNGGVHQVAQVTRSIHLRAGRQYLRVSYFQGPCCGAEMHLLWQPPTAASLQVVPSDALWTQAEAVHRPVIFIHGIGDSELAATQDGSATLDTGHGGTNTESFHAGDIVWVNGCKAGTPLGGDQQDYFDLIRFKDDGSAPLVPSIQANGHLNTRPTCLGIGPELPYAQVEPFFQRHGYVRDKDFFLFVYDWRYPAEAHRSRLDALVSQVTQQTGVKVDMIAHSLGALVARDYLVNGSARESVGHVVMLGGVNLGTPIAAAAITHGIGLGGCTLEPQLKQQSPPCSFRASEVQDIMRTLPSARELSPSPAYYGLFDGRDSAHPIAYVDDRAVLNGGSSVTTYDALQARMTQSHAAPPLRGLAEALHQDDLGWIVRAPAGTSIDLVAGTGFCTLGQIREYQEVVPPILPLLQATTRDAIDYRLVDGDAYVVRQSATLQDTQTGFAANGRARITLTNIDHVDLITNDGLNIALQLLNGTAVTSQTPRPDVADLCAAISVHSPMELVATDSAGNQVGSFDGAAILGSVPGGLYYRISDTKLTALHHADRYQVNFRGTADGDATVRVRWITPKGVRRMALFPHVPTTATSRASMSVDTQAGFVGDLVVDTRGDGTTLFALHPTVLDGSATEDTTPPDLRIDSPAAGQNTVGSFPVSWTATDTESGVGSSFGVLESTSGTRRILSAPGPVELPPGDYTLTVYAEDRAGNLAVRTRRFTQYASAWLPPLRPDGTFTGNAGRTIPVKFTVTQADGSLVSDQSVTVALQDAQGRQDVGPLAYAADPSLGVSIEPHQYHSNVKTPKGLQDGVHTLHVHFESPRLLGTIDLPITLR